MQKIFLILTLAICIFFIGCNVLTKDLRVTRKPEIIEKGKKVTLDYILAVNGKVIDSSEKRGLMKYIHGNGAIIKGLEKQLKGLQIGDERTIIVSPEEGYGLVDSKAIREVSKSFLPKNFAPQPGQWIQLRDKNGRKFPARIVEVRDKTVVFDFNHPLAGQELQYRVKIRDIQPEK